MKQYFDGIYERLEAKKLLSESIWNWIILYIIIERKVIIVVISVTHIEKHIIRFCLMIWKME